jgi:hypothetical protein
LILIEQRHARVVGHVQGRALNFGFFEFVGRAESLVETLARFVFELRAEVIAKPHVEAVLEGADAFEERGLALAVETLELALFVFAELMRVVEATEKLGGVVHAIDAKINRVYVAVVEPEARSFARPVGAVGGEREEGLRRNVRVALFVLDFRTVFAERSADGEHAQPPERERENDKGDREIN